MRKKIEDIVCGAVLLLIWLAIQACVLYSIATGYGF